jgi:heme A synthase
VRVLVQFLLAGGIGLVVHALVGYAVSQRTEPYLVKRNPRLVYWRLSISLVLGVWMITLGGLLVFTQGGP